MNDEALAGAEKEVKECLDKQIKFWSEKKEIASSFLDAFKRAKKSLFKE